MEGTEIKIPSVVPAMTLRDAVLFPKAMMPLRIFEDRYRLMLKDALRGDRMFALVGGRSDAGAPFDQDFFDVATVGLIRVSKKHEDGTSFVLLQGVERVKVVSIRSEEPYRMLDVEPIERAADAQLSEQRDGEAVGLDDETEEAEDVCVRDLGEQRRLACELEGERRQHQLGHAAGAKPLDGDGEAIP